MLSKITTMAGALVLLLGIGAADDSVHTGDGTYYLYSGSGNCSFPVSEGVLIAAMNTTDYNASAACGGLIEVTNDNTGLSVVVRIDDRCPECAAGDVDLNQSAFAQIADLTDGRVPISWHYIANDQAGNVKLYFKDGSNPWWVAVQAHDHMYPITRMEYRISGSGNPYEDIPRADYNYFIASIPSGSSGPFDFRITDFWGSVIETPNIPFLITTEIDTGTQFPKHETATPPTMAPVLFLLLQ